jgi:hypothetical protein
MVKKFYFLDYFLILLQSCKAYQDKELIFSSFKNLKDKLRLGESKYRKLTIDENDLSENQVKRYRYTFDQVIIESSNYKLVKEKGNKILLTELGLNSLILAEKDKNQFYNRMLSLMEAKYSAFYHLVKLCYHRNKVKNGLLIFPIYSPRKLGFEKSMMKTNGDLIKYADKLRKRLELDIKNFLSKNKNLNDINEILLTRLIDENLLGTEKNRTFDQTKYNAIIGRFRKYWLNFFLKNLYGYEYSFDTFNIWVERGKQLGIVHSTEFFPDFDGRLVFPTSIIVQENNNQDLLKAFSYLNSENLYVHKPSWKNINNQNNFIDALVESYFDLKRNRRMQFIRLSDLRERVCYKLRIPSFVFNDFLEKTYHESLKGLTKIQISLEADRLPYETSAMYLKREPVLVNGLYKNIIAIDYKK